MRVTIFIPRKSPEWEIDLNLVLGSVRSSRNANLCLSGSNLSRCQERAGFSKISLSSFSELTGHEPPDQPDEEYDDEDHQKDVTDLDDTIANNADDSESVKDDDKNEHDDDDRDSTAKKDEVKDHDNDDERDQDTEVYEGKKGISYNWFRPRSMSYDPCPRQGDDMPFAQAYGYDDNDEDNDHDPVDSTHEDEKFCQSCYMSDYPPHVFQSHHTSQILACPSISNIDKQRLIERYKKGLYKFPSYPK